MKKLSILSILFSTILLSCSNGQNTLYSKNYTDEEKIKTLSKYITVKSTIEWTEFVLFDVNLNSNSIPGASSKKYNVIIKVNPKDTHLWIDEKNNWITSFPHKMEWIDTILDKNKLQYIKSLGYFTYYNESPSNKYTIWVNQENGIIIIEYVEE